MNIDTQISDDNANAAKHRAKQTEPDVKNEGYDNRRQKGNNLIVSERRAKSANADINHGQQRQTDV